MFLSTGVKAPARPLICIASHDPSIYLHDAACSADQTDILLNKMLQSLNDNKEKKAVQNNEIHKIRGKYFITKYKL